jgi:hypothetical protein
MTSHITLKVLDGPPIPIDLGAVKYGPNGYLCFYHRGAIVGRLASNTLAEFAGELHRAADTMIQYTVAETESGKNATTQRPDPRKLTPAQVIAYFEQSPILSSIAADVRAVLEPLVTEAEGPVDQLSLDLAACRPHTDLILNYDGSLRWGAQSRIAEILGIKNAGQNNRERILAVANAIENSTTSTRLEPVEVQAAA